MKTFTIDRLTWYRGKNPTTSRLLRSDGMMCCVGHIGKQCGLDDIALLEQCYPRTTMNPQAFPEFLRGCHFDATRVFELNDDEYFTDEQREHELKKVFSKHLIRRADYSKAWAMTILAFWNFRTLSKRLSDSSPTSTPSSNPSPRQTNNVSPSIPSTKFKEQEGSSHPNTMKQFTPEEVTEAYTAAENHQLGEWLGEWYRRRMVEESAPLTAEDLQSLLISSGFDTDVGDERDLVHKINHFLSQRATPQGVRRLEPDDLERAWLKTDVTMNRNQQWAIMAPVLNALTSPQPEAVQEWEEFTGEHGNHHRYPRQGVQFWAESEWVEVDQISPPPAFPHTYSPTGRYRRPKPPAQPSPVTDAAPVESGTPKGILEPVGEGVTVGTDAVLLMGPELIRLERIRQIKAEGWETWHDDQEHPFGQLAKAAALYAMKSYWLMTIETQRLTPDEVPDGWPWEASWWKPSPNPIRNLVKAGALIAAEIERLIRAGIDPEARPDWPKRPPSAPEVASAPSVQEGIELPKAPVVDGGEWNVFEENTTTHKQSDLWKENGSWIEVPEWSLGQPNGNRIRRRKKPATVEQVTETPETPETDRLREALVNSCFNAGLEPSSLSVAMQIVDEFQKDERQRDTLKAQLEEAKLQNAKLKGAEDANRLMRMHDFEVNKQLTADNARLVKEEKEWEQSYLNTTHELKKAEREIKHLKASLAWVAVSPETMPKESDADRNGNVEWLNNRPDSSGYMFSANLSNMQNLDATHWRPTNLPALPKQESEDAGFEAWAKSNDLKTADDLRVSRAAWNAAKKSIDK